MLSRNSRYANVPQGALEVGDRKVPYIKMRPVPEPAASQFVHVVGAGERPDHLAYRYYRDPERFWRLCDANRIMWPNDLVREAGRAIVVPPPEA
jgi:hypothetical protein